MLWHFKKTKSLYLGLCFSGMIAAAAVAIRIRFTPNIDISFEHGYVVLFVLLLWTVLAGFVGTFYAMKNRFKIQNIVFNDCDPLKCISELDKIIDPRNPPKTYSNCFLLDMVWALLADGKTEEAFEYVLSNGNRLAAVKTAEEYLNKISKKRALRVN